MEAKVKIGLQIFAFAVIGVPLSALSYFAIPEVWNSYSRAEVQTSIQTNDIVEHSESPITVLALGDMMLDRGVRNKIASTTEEYPFVNIKSFLSGNDLVVANAEGAFTHFKSKVTDLKNKQLVFTFDPATLPTLKKLGFNVLSQANNHSLNFGTEGLIESELNIEQNGMNWFGDPMNEDGITFATSTRGVKIAFVGFHQFSSRGLKNVIKEIADYKNSGHFVIVYPHWGEEYNKNFTQEQQRLAHMFIDAGVDVIIGAHPHVIEPIEIYNKKPIFYSLGNFIFDQDFSRNTKEGLAIGISIYKDKTEYAIFPLSIENRQVSVMRNERRWEILDKLASSSLTVDMAKKEGIRVGIFNSN